MTFEDVKRIRENPTAEDVDNQELHRLIDIALEKQIPKKTLLTKSPYKIVRACPVCNRRIFMEEKYCVNCGQALDWEGDTK